MLLAADIGGTQARIALYHPEKTPHSPCARETFISSDFTDIHSLLRTFLFKQHNLLHNQSITHAVLAVAGPVFSQSAQLCNLPWPTVHAHKIAQQLHIDHVYLLNDLQACAHALTHIATQDIITLHQAPRNAQGTHAVLAPGTGLGEAFLSYQNKKYIAYPSEGGHASFGPSDPLLLKLCAFLMDKEGYVSNEDICSGRGIYHIYQFLKKHSPLNEEAWLTAHNASHQQIVPHIIHAGINPNNVHFSPLCGQTLSLFLRVLGNIASNLALRLLPTGGIFIGGGIVPRLLPLIQHDDAFIQGFTHKGRMRELVERFPIFLLQHPQPALLGAAQLVFSHAQQYEIIK